MSTKRKEITHFFQKNIAADTGISWYRRGMVSRRQGCELKPVKHAIFFTFRLYLPYRQKHRKRKLKSALFTA